MTDTPRPLSPAAQAVVDVATLAYLSSPGVTLEPALAAALRAAADATPAPNPHEEDAFHAGYWAAVERNRAIANELDPRPQ